MLYVIIIAVGDIMNGVVIDLILLLVLVLVTLIGLYKGFLRELVSFGGFIGSIVISYFLYKPFIDVLDKLFHWGTKIANFVMGQVGALSSSFATETGSTVEELRNIIDNSNAGLYKQVLKQFIGKTDFSNGATTVASAIGTIVSGFVMGIISFAILFLLLKIVTFILDKLLRLIPKKSAVGVVNKWLGFALGFVKGAVIVGGVLVITYFLCLLPGVNAFITPYMESTYVTKYVYKFLGELVVKFV